jgi:hypothetical protein
MALSERYVNAWHMLIERQYLICINYVYWSGVQVSKWYYGYLRVRQNKSLIITIYYYLLILYLITQWSIILKSLDIKVNNIKNKCV